MNYTTPSFSGEFSIDMGDATPGSYISLETGYVKGGIEISQNAVSLPISIYPMIPPKIVGTFGPFDQAIAPVPCSTQTLF